MQALENRISNYVDINWLDMKVLRNLPHKIETRRPGEDIITEGEVSNSVFIIESGWAMRYRILDDGRRQILNFMLPGDCFDLMSLTQAKSDHSVNAATEVEIRRIDTQHFVSAISHSAKLAMAFWWVAIQEEAILREQIIRVGRRSATERVGHIILELNRRLAFSMGEETDFVSLPVPQALLADALGLSVVHISRTFSKLRSKGFIATSSDGIEILRRDELARLSDFDNRYLHMEKLKLAS